MFFEWHVVWFASEERLSNFYKVTDISHDFNWMKNIDPADEVIVFYVYMA